MVPPTSGTRRSKGNGGVQRVRVPKTAELVAAELRRLIIRGTLSAGEALPPESELIEQFGVSRPTLREAFRVLESESLIVIRRGANGGARVQPPRREVAARYAGFILEYQGATVRDVYEARTFLEVPSVGRLARCRTDADLALLNDALDRDDRDCDPQEAIRVHSEFHQLVVQLAGNATLAVLSDMVHHIIEVANESLQPAVGPRAEQARRTTGRTHRKLVEHIRDRDPDAAEELWRRHLGEAEGYVLGGDPGSTVLDLLGGRSDRRRSHVLRRAVPR
ncbi:GntR family transcriptional regulator [Nocardia nova]|uniref:GntR family transcriptional regulator n=1 Tax=Nocardia nova TaxID=37330 RepID=A0A2S6A695_9NOCA|nr:GntR family transcriptional regulator [Nocardia nova]PPJ28001.1 GntR family transcriptional regulator [Nocardia nova]